MPKLYFKYGVMGSSKSAQALITKFNYEQKGFKVLLMKPIIDTRDIQNGVTIVASRIGLKSECYSFDLDFNLAKYIRWYIDNNQNENVGAVIVDEAQFCTADQIDQLKEMSNIVPVLCYGLKSDFKSYLFSGSKRLLEIADSITEIKAICRCGAKATMNAKLINGVVVTKGDSIDIGGDEKYEAMCFNCWKRYQNKDAK